MENGEFRYILDRGRYFGFSLADKIDVYFALVPDLESPDDPNIRLSNNDRTCTLTLDRPLSLVEKAKLLFYDFTVE